MDIPGGDAVNLAAGGAMGAVLLGGLMKIWRSLADSIARRAAADGSLDQRAAKFGELYDELLQDERAEKRRLQEELSKATERFTALNENWVKLITEQHGQQQTSIERIRQEYHDIVRRLDDRLDTVEIKHAACEATVVELRAILIREGRPLPMSSDLRIVPAAPGGLTSSA